MSVVTPEARESVQPYTATNSFKSYLFNKIVSKILWLFCGNIVTVRNKESGINIEYIVFTAGKLNDSTAPKLA
jgi:hypothetical protein